MNKINKWKENGYKDINDLGYLQYGPYCETCGQLRLSHLDIYTNKKTIFNETFKKCNTFKNKHLTIDEIKNDGNILAKNFLINYIKFNNDKTYKSKNKLYCPWCGASKHIGGTHTKICPKRKELKLKHLKNLKELDMNNLNINDDIDDDVDVDVDVDDDDDVDITNQLTPNDKGINYDVINKYKNLEDKIDTLEQLFENFQQSIKQIELNNIKLENNDKKQDLNDKLYPNLYDKNLMQKISNKQEFHETNQINENDIKQYIKNIEIESNKICNNNIFELNPHQKFVRNFLSNETPYNGLLLYHGLGTGKTCSSILICEDMRKYLKNNNMKNKKIYVIASSVVIVNYKLQLFDENKLILKKNGLWHLNTCVGNNLLNEVNPMNIKNIPKETIIKNINNIIKNSYRFYGYTKFANKIKRLLKNNSKSKLIDEFADTIIVIDEVQNIKNNDDLIGKDKDRYKASIYYNELMKYTDNTKLLLLSATPIFNDYKEIIWITNLLNLNDNRYILNNDDIFNDNKEDGIFKEGGIDLLKQKLNGYVSFIMGENPLSFPYRIFPNEINDKNSIIYLLKKTNWLYPDKELLNNKIENKYNKKNIPNTDTIVLKMGDIQQDMYIKITNKIKNKEKLNKKTNKLEKILKEGQSINYSYMDAPLQILNMTYPNKDGYGINGLNGIMKHKSNIGSFQYKIDNEHVFDMEHLHKYSNKIHYVINKIKQSKGVVIIYSRYIYGGCIPMALALESAGITRYNDKNLFKNIKQFDKIDIYGKKQKNDNDEKFIPARYIMITGNSTYSPNKKEEFIAATNNNINGEKVKVIIISKAGSEGLDFKNIRQIHILEPWFNLNRINQIIGRGVRNKSHCALDYKHRNVEIYLYASMFNNDNGIEALDLYLYRFAENKAIDINKVLKVMKETSVDCLLTNNKHYIDKYHNKYVQQHTSSDNKIRYKIGYKDNTLLCDYGVCDYKCDNNRLTGTIDNKTYGYNHMIRNNDIIIKKIKAAFSEFYMFNEIELINEINKGIIKYSDKQIKSALNMILNNDQLNLFFLDILKNPGKIVKINNNYLFQPINIHDKYIPIDERLNEQPIFNKYHKIKIKNKVDDKLNDKYMNKNMGNDIYNNMVKFYDILNNNDDDVNINKNFNKQHIFKDINKYIMHILDREEYDIFKSIFIKYTIYSYIDFLNFENKKSLYLFIMLNKKDDVIYDMLLNFFKSYTININNDEYIGFGRYDKNKGTYFNFFKILSNKLKGGIKYVDNAYVSNIYNQKFINNKVYGNVLGYNDWQQGTNLIKFYTLRKSEIIDNKLKHRKGLELSIVNDIIKKIIKILNNKLKSFKKYPNIIYEINILIKILKNISKKTVKFKTSHRYIIIELLLRYLEDNERFISSDIKYFYNILQYHILNLYT